VAPGPPRSDDGGGLASDAVPELAETKAVVVDAWPMIRLGLVTCLTGAGVRTVAETDDAPGALAAVRQHRPALVVVGEIGSPVAELIARLVALDTGARTIAVLASVGPDELRDLLGTGVDAVVGRGVGPEELAGTCRRVLSGERVVSPAVLPLLFEQTVDITDPVSPLTSKEREVIRLVAAGRSNGQIAEALFVSPATIKTHLAHIYVKLEAKGRHEALARAAALGLLT